MIEQPGIRSRKRDKTHADIARAAFALAREHGLDGFTVDDAAARADVARRTFFNHFQSKEEAVSEVVRLQMAAALNVAERILWAHSAAETGPDTSDPGPDPHDLTAALRAFAAPLPSIPDKDETTYQLRVTIHAVLREDTITFFQELADLARRYPTLEPHVAAIRLSVVDEAAELLRSGDQSGTGLPPVYAYALPGAVTSTLWAVYSGHLKIVELGSRAPDAITIDDLVRQLRSLVPDDFAC